MSLTLDSYSHGNFFVTGKTYHVDFATLADDMRRIWDEVKTSDYLKTISEPAFP
jgi:hypothetical protein